MRGVLIIQLLQFLQRPGLRPVHQPADHGEKFCQIDYRETVFIKSNVLRICPVLIRQVCKIQRYDSLFPVIATGLDPLQLLLVFEPCRKIYPVQNAVFNQRFHRDTVRLTGRLQIAHNLRGQKICIFLRIPHRDQPPDQNQGKPERNKPFCRLLPSAAFHKSSLRLSFICARIETEQTALPFT